MYETYRLVTNETPSLVLATAQSSDRREAIRELTAWAKANNEWAINDLQVQCLIRIDRPTTLEEFGKIIDRSNAPETYRLAESETQFTYLSNTGDECLSIQYDRRDEVWIWQECDDDCILVYGQGDSLEEAQATKHLLKTHQPTPVPYGWDKI